MIRLSGFRPTAEGVDRATDIDAVALAVSSHESSFRDADLAYRLRGLAMIGSVLHLGTHPDDEEAGFMAYPSRGVGARAGDGIADGWSGRSFGPSVSCSRWSWSAGGRAGLRTATVSTRRSGW